MITWGDHNSGGDSSDVQQELVDVKEPNCWRPKVEIWQELTRDDKMIQVPLAVLNSSICVF